MGVPEKTFACMTLLFMRQDRDRSEGMAHWRGAHAQLVARAPGRREYRQHHFAPDGGGWWPAPTSVETEPPSDRRVDGIPEVTFTSVLSALRGRVHKRLIQADEANAFRRTLMYLTSPGGSRWWRNTASVEKRAVVLLRRSPQTSAKEFAAFLDSLGERLAAQTELLEVRTLAFAPWKRATWDTPGVDHENPTDQQFHGALVLGGASLDAIRGAVGTAVKGLEQSQAQHLVAAHAYDVELTLIYRDEDRPTLPQTADTPG